MALKNPPGDPMTLGNMRRLGVHHLAAFCLTDACRHQGLIDVSKFPDDVEVSSFGSKVVCAKCGARGRHRCAAELERTAAEREPDRQGVAMTLDEAYSLVGKFMYHFAHVERKIDQAVIKLLDLNDTAAPVVTGGIDFAKKVNFVRTAAARQISDQSVKDFAEKTCNKVYEVNTDRQIVAHSSFEPDGDGVQFSRTVAKDGRVRVDATRWTEAEFSDRCSRMLELEADLGRLIEQIKPVPLGWLGSFQEMYHRPHSAWWDAMATSGPEGPLTLRAINKDNKSTQ